MKNTVYLTTTASLSIDVEVPDGTDLYEAREAAIEAAFENAPQICGQCSGWRRGFSLDLGDWDVEKDATGKEVEPEVKED